MDPNHCISPKENKFPIL